MLHLQFSYRFYLKFLYCKCSWGIQFFSLKHLTATDVLHCKAIFSPQGSRTRHNIITISQDMVSFSPGARGIAWGWGSKATGAKCWAAGAALWAGSSAQRAGSAAQPGPPGAAGAGDTSGAAPTTGLRLWARGATPARGPLYWASKERRQLLAALRLPPVCVASKEYNCNWLYCSIKLLLKIFVYMQVSISHHTAEENKCTYLHTESKPSGTLILFGWLRTAVSPSHLLLKLQLLMAHSPWH